MENSIEKYFCFPLFYDKNFHILFSETILVDKLMQQLEHIFPLYFNQDLCRFLSLIGILICRPQSKFNRIWDFLGRVF
jgi:hypothetical protein